MMLISFSLSFFFLSFLSVNLLPPANHIEFHVSVKIIDRKGRNRIPKIHRSDDLHETKMPRDVIKQTRKVFDEFQCILTCPLDCQKSNSLKLFMVTRVIDH